MKPNPLELLNHFTVPCTSDSLLNRDFEIALLSARCITLTPPKIRIARSVPESRFESIEHSFFIARISLRYSARKNDSMNFSGFIVFAGKGTGNKREYRRWTWRLEASRLGSSLQVAYGYRYG